MGFVFVYSCHDDGRHHHLECRYRCSRRRRFFVQGEDSLAAVVLMVVVEIPFGKIF